MLNRVMVFARKYAKALVAAGGLVVMAGNALAGEHVSASHAADLAISLVTALAVYRVPNKAPQANSQKP
jgi:hypothetical protein